MLAFIQGEPGAEAVRPLVGNAAASAVNVAEAGAYLADRGLNEPEIRRSINLLDVEIVAFDAETAYLCSMLRPETRARGLSLGDRACLALAKRRGLPAVTADRLWTEISVGVEVRLIRE